MKWMGKSIRHKWVTIMLNTPMLIGAGGSNNQVFREKKRTNKLYFPINASVAIL